MNKFGASARAFSLRGLQHVKSSWFTRLVCKENLTRKKNFDYTPSRVEITSSNTTLSINTRFEMICILENNANFVFIMEDNLSLWEFSMEVMVKSTLFTAGCVLHEYYSRNYGLLLGHLGWQNIVYVIPCRVMLPIISLVVGKVVPFSNQSKVVFLHLLTTSIMYARA